MVPSVHRLPMAATDHERQSVPNARSRPLTGTTAPPRVGRPVSIGALTGKAAGPALGKRGLAGGQLITHWGSIVGEELAALACPLELKFPRQRNDGASLILRVAHGSAATLIQMKTPVILERVNAFFGYAAVWRIQAVQGPLPQPTQRPAPPPAPLAPQAAAEVARCVDGVRSAEVKSALLKLGETLARRRQEIESKN
ncbi:MAG: DciA family protein [Rhodospirillaceae bacterium]|nr:DciA family protein [Rhodospirillaceae bacterium]